MKTYRIILSVAVASVLWACSVDEQMQPQTDAPAGPTVSDEGTVPGIMTVKVSDDLADRLLEYADEQGELNADGVALLNISGIHCPYYFLALVVEAYISSVEAHTVLVR